MKFVKLKSIKYIGKKRTYDLNVKDNHNFFLSNGILSHNCSSSQSFYETNVDFRGSVSDVLLMKLSADDLKSFNRDFRVSAENFSSLTTLKTGEFIFLKDIQSTYETATKFKTFHVPFAHREPTYDDFVTEFCRCYPHRTKSMKKEITVMRNEFKKHSETQKQIVYEHENKKIEKVVKKRKAKEEKRLHKLKGSRPSVQNNQPTQQDNIQENQTENNNTEVSEKVKQKSEMVQHCFDIVNRTPDSTWNSRVLLCKYDISEPHFKKIVFEHALYLEDYEFLAKHYQQKYVKSNYQEFFDKIFKPN